MESNLQLETLLGRSLRKSAVPRLHPLIPHNTRTTTTKQIVRSRQLDTSFLRYPAFLGLKNCGGFLGVVLDNAAVDGFCDINEGVPAAFYT